MATLTDRQFEIDGFVFGWRAPSRIGISDVDFGSPEARTNDFDRPRLDGQRFGREYRSGRLITLELVTLHTGEQALDDLERFLEAWNAAAVRDSPGDMSVLRYNVRGRTRRVYGRPREVELETADYHLGKIVITAQFMTEGPYFYGDEPEQTTVGIAPGITGGFVFPLSFPASTIGMGERREGVVNPSRLPAPAVFDIHGPIENPIIEIPGVWRFQLLTTVHSNQTVRVDTRPWALTVYRDATNLAGRITVGSPRLPEMKIPPGPNDLVLRGTDPTAMAALNVQVWPQYTSF